MIDNNNLFGRKMMETNVSLRFLLYSDVFWASSCLQSIASSRSGGEWTFPRPVACLGGVQLIGDSCTFLEVQITPDKPEILKLDIPIWDQHFFVLAGKCRKNDASIIL